MHQKRLLLEPPIPRAIREEVFLLSYRCWMHQKRLPSEPPIPRAIREEVFLLSYRCWMHQKILLSEPPIPRAIREEVFLLSYRCWMHQKRSLPEPPILHAVREEVFLLSYRCWMHQKRSLSEPPILHAIRELRRLPPELSVLNAPEDAAIRASHNPCHQGRHFLLSYWYWMHHNMVLSEPPITHAIREDISPGVFGTECTIRWRYQNLP